MPRITLEESVQILHPDLNVIKIAKDQDWEIMAFSVGIINHTVIQKIGLELKSGSEAFIGEFAIYKTSPGSS